MSRQHVVEELYQGEVFGEALFNRMLRDADDDRQRHVVASLLQLETETKALLCQAVAARRLRLEEDEAQRASGETIAASLGDLTWLDKMERLRAGIADHFLPRYQRIAAEAEADDREVTALMVRHEAALLESSPARPPARSRRRSPRSQSTCTTRCPHPAERRSPAADR
ncbi:MAG: hypothetical protein ACRD2C_05125 [Acidimicrobiales bacterium]